MGVYFEMSGSSWPPLLPRPAMAQGGTLLRSEYLVIRRAAGSYVAGEWGDGAESDPFPILANIQPAGLTDYSMFQAQTGGDRVGQMIRIYTDFPLMITDPEYNAAGGSGRSGDLILYDACDAEFDGPARWLVVRGMRWTGIIPHRKYLARKVVAA